MLETIGPYFAYVVALAVAAIIPGPGVAAVVGRSLFNGSRGSVLFILGLAFGDVVFLTIGILGLSTIAAFASQFFFIVKVLGGLYLLYLGWKFWVAPIQTTELVDQPSGSGLTAFGGGFCVTLGNPKTVVFYLALLPNVIDLAVVDVTDWAILSVLTLITLFAVLIGYAACAMRLRKALTTPRALRKLNRSAAALIGGAGVMILYDALGRTARTA